MTESSYCLRSINWVLLVALTSLAGQFGCSGDATNPGSANGGVTSAGGGSPAGGLGVGGSTSSSTGTGVGGQSSSGGVAQVGGNSTTGAGGVCGSGCTAVSTTPSAECGTLPVTLSCMGPFPSNLSAIMSANNCFNLPINSVAYCCPAAILTTCR